MRTDAPADANDRTTVERRDPLVGTILDRRFRIDLKLAAGGFGAIYRATDVLSDAEVALKVLLPQMARDPNVVARFRREGATLSSLRDPHTITAYELGEAPDGTLYIVMELLHGESLYEQFRATGPLPWRRVVHIARGVCSSLAEAHAAGIVHRDLKPANIHLEVRGGDPDFVKVLDFGIAKIVQGAEYDRTELTQAGHMIGTVDYMSPEQMVGGEMTARSDIYTLGVVMYEMIGGRTPFADAQSATAILAAVLTRTVEPLSRHADVPLELDRIVARCLVRDPQGRFGDVGELDDALAEVLSPGPARPVPVTVRLQPAEHVTTTYVRQTPLEDAPSAARPAELPKRAPVRPTPIELVGGLPVRPSPVEFVGGLPARATPVRPPVSDVITSAPVRPPPAEEPHVVAPPPAASIAAMGTSGFEQDIPTTDATRIDVRLTDSSHPVLDARGPRQRVPEGFVPSDPYLPPVLPVGSVPLIPDVPAHARGSQHAIDAGGWHPVPQGRGSLPPFERAVQPPPVQPPLVQPPLVQPPLVQPPLVPPPPRVRPSTHEIEGYDLGAAASYDAAVRRIIWLSLIVAVIVAILIATH
jgi:serine/threonine-protein kinase